MDYLGENYVIMVSSLPIHDHNKIFIFLVLFYEVTYSKCFFNLNMQLDIAYWCLIQSSYSLISDNNLYFFQFLI